MDFQKDLKINKNRLDEELMAQAQKMMRYSSEHAQAQYDRDRAKQALDVTKANLIQSIRAEALAKGEKMGAGGVTDAVVDARLRSSPTYIEIQGKLNEAELKVNIVFGAVMAFQARKGMLESLVKLFLAGYWSEPRVEGGENMRAGAAMAATEEAILREVPQDDFKYVKYAIGYINKSAPGLTPVGYEEGPFDFLEQALKRIPGTSGPTGIWEIEPNKAAELIREWHDKVGWVAPVIKPVVLPSSKPSMPIRPTPRVPPKAGRQP